MTLRRFSIRIALLRASSICVIVAAALAAVTAQAQDIGTLQKQAKAGDADAQYQLAKAYFSGNGVQKDSKAGVEWLEKSAGLEHPPAQLALARLYLSGEQNIPKDPKRGLDWLQKSAGHDYAPAEHDLAVMYLDGDGETGISRKPHEAATWFRKAARQQGSPKSQASLAEMLQKGLITKQEANWQAPEPSSSPPKPAKSGPAPFSLAEVETGLKGSITSKRMTTLIQQFGVDFSLSEASQKRLADAGATPDLLQVLSTSKRPL